MVEYKIFYNFYQRIKHKSFDKKCVIAHDSAAQCNPRTFLPEQNLGYSKFFQC